MQVYRSVVQQALHTAIKETEQQEKRAGYTSPSGYLHVIKELAAALQRGESITFHPET
jgi:hypothetical protein